MLYRAQQAVESHHALLSALPTHMGVREKWGRQPMSALLWAGEQQSLLSSLLLISELQRGECTCLSPAIS